MFEIVGDKFYLNGEPFQIISGSIHYFRVLPRYWEDRLEKLSAAIQSGQGDGMMNFNQCLLELVNSGRVTREDALGISDNPEGLKMNFEGIFLSADAGGGLVG